MISQRTTLIVLAAATLLAVVVGWRRQSAEPVRIDYPKLYQAIALAEGDNGRRGPDGEIGPLQITTVCRRDLARLGLPLAEDDCRSPNKSLAALVVICSHYHAKDVRDAALLWNAGPDRRGRGADRYADRVCAYYGRE